LPLTCGIMDDQYLLWAMISLGLAVILFLLELFIPSGGLLGVGAFMAAVVGVVLLFIENATYGLIGTLLCVIAMPLGVIWALRVWPHTPIGRMLILKSAEAPSDLAASAGTDTLTSLVDQTGDALTDLRPVGACRINGKRVECLAQGGVIRAGAKVRVVSADGMAVKVREDA